MNFNLPDNVSAVLKRIEKAGFEAYIVGGCVRDILLCKTPADYDVTTSATPEQIKRIFTKTVDTGIKHGTVTVLENGEPIEVTTFRTESGYGDFRHPENVTFVTDITEDLRRRDFTVNAMAYSERTGLIDRFGGENDLKNKILRAVGNPRERFTEDALRILRLFRFASVLGFKAEKETCKAALELSDNLGSVSAERIREELIKAVNGDYPDALSPLIKSGALTFSGIETELNKDISRLPKGNIRTFAFLHLCGGDTKNAANRLKFSNRQKEYFEKLSTLLKSEIKEDAASIKIALNAADDCFADYLTLREFLTGSSCESLYEIYRKIINNGEPYRIKDLKISGDELLELGFTGKQVGAELNKLLLLVTRNPELNERQKLIQILKS